MAGKEPNIRAIMRRRAASKNEGPSCKVRKREVDPTTKPTRPSVSREIDLGNIRSRLCSRFSSGAQKSPCVDQTDGTDTSQKNYTPLESQVMAIKERHPNTVLMVECGYRFRFFGDDAELAAKELCILCSRDRNLATASVPTHRVGIHLEHLVSRGHKVGIVRQMESAALKSVGASKSTVFDRELTELFTKSTLVGEDLQLTSQDATAGGFMVSICDAVSSTPNRFLVGIAAVQPTTGEVLYDSFEDSSSCCELEQRLESLRPVEVLLSEKPRPSLAKAVSAFQSSSREGIRVERLPAEQLDFSACLDALTKFYGGDGCNTSDLERLAALPPVVVCCLGVLLAYLSTFKLEEVLKDTSRLTAMSEGCQRVNLTGATFRRLDLLRNSVDCTTKGSLFGLLDQTATAFGRRLLFSWISQPLCHLGAIEERQDAVADILSVGCGTFDGLRKSLSRMPDLQRGLCSILHKKVKPSDAFEILSSLVTAWELVDLLRSDRTLNLRSMALCKCISRVAELLKDVEDHLSLLNAAAARSNNMVVLFKDLSRYPSLMKCSSDIADIEKKLRALRRPIAMVLGVSNFDYKTVSGMPYLIEVSSRKLSSVPSSWLKISSTKAADRFRSPEVDSLYKDLCVAKELMELESRKSWVAFLGDVSRNYNKYQRGVRSIATLDCFLSLARVASQPGYCRPKMLPKEERLFQIRKGRHPILELRMSSTSQYVPNDTDLGGEQQCCIITGPNMGGKSSYMRQVALIAVMAHVGSYVPAESAAISLLDGVYVRMGADDAIGCGKSTFLCEMEEVSEILAKCSCHSLVILDELGRGTATHDGTAIALATLRYLVERVCCPTLFVTHYLPITEMETFYEGIVTNQHAAFGVDEEGTVTFLYSMTPGAAEKSYGLNVAALAGVPENVIQRAREKAEALEKQTQQKKALPIVCSAVPAC